MISSLTFANRLVYKDRSNISHGGEIIYNQGGTMTVDINDVKPFACHITASEVDLILFEYLDGKRLHFCYTLERVEGTPVYYNLSWYMKMTDSNNTLITGLGWANPTQTYTESIAWSDSEPGFDTIPFSVMYYVPSVVNYFTSGQVTVVGDQAQVAYVWGNIFWKNARPPIGGYIDILGTNSIDALGQSFGNRYVAALISSDNLYTGYFNLVDPDGDWHEAGDVEPTPDPSGPGGGDFPTDDDGDPVDFPSLPGTSVINTGLITLFSPDNTQLRSLAGVLWGNDFEQSIKKVLNDPFDGLIGLSMIPFTPTTSGNIACYIGNFNTNISMPIISAQYYTLDFGSINVKENWRNALDYNSTSIEIFVPFVGFRTLDIQDCMNKTLQLKYNVDILTGSGVAILKCGNKCLYEWPCNLSYTIPLTGSNRAALYTGLINVALSGAGGLAAGGAMGAVAGAATSAINVATHAQSDVQRSGAIVSNTGVLGEFTPYLVIHRPKQSLAQDFKNFKGYQSNITVSLGTLSGYTEVEYIHLTGIDGATDTELSEIERLLKEGVLI